MASVQGQEQQKIGELIRQQRKKKKLTQTQLAQFLDVGTQAISDYEKGKIKVIPFEKRVKLARILEISLADLLYENEKKGEEIPEEEVPDALKFNIDEKALARARTFIETFEAKLVQTVIKSNKVQEIILQAIQNTDTQYKNYDDIPNDAMKKLADSIVASTFESKNLQDSLRDAIYKQLKILANTAPDTKK